MRDDTESPSNLLDGSSLQLRLANAISNAVTSKKSGVFVILEVDFGPHQAQEGELLVETSNRIQSEMQASSEIIKIEKRQLLAILNDVGSDSVARLMLGKLIARLETPCQTNEFTILPRVAAGYVSFPSQAVSSKALLVKADIALQRAKEIRLCKFDKTMQQDYNNRRRLQRRSDV